MAADLIRNPKPPSWLVKGYLEADGLGLLYGAPKKGKSFAAIDWACSVATGSAWHGHATKQGPVFYLAGEGHNGLARRLIAWSLHRGVSLEGAPLAISNRAAPMTDPKAAAEVSAAVARLADETGRHPALIVVDTLARNFGADENSTEDMTRFVRHLDDIRNQWKATVLVVHHSGKDATRGARGSIALLGAVDASYYVTRDEFGIVRLEPEALKDAGLPPAKNFELKAVGLPFADEDGAPLFSCALREMAANYAPPARGKVGRGKNQTKALDRLTRLWDTHRARVERSGRDPDEARVLVADWRAECMGDGIAANRWPEVLGTLKDAGLVQVEGIYVTTCLNNPAFRFVPVCVPVCFRFVPVSRSGSVPVYLNRTEAENRNLGNRNRAKPGAQGRATR
jgi:hypothetical protein